MLNKNIDAEALKKAIYGNTGWNFMCTPQAMTEIDAYCESGNFDLMSKETLKALNGIYRYIAQDYNFYSKGKFLPNIFATLE